VVVILSAGLGLRHRFQANNRQWSGLAERVDAGLPAAIQRGVDDGLADVREVLKTHAPGLTLNV
jgi:hypothetical protein